MAQNKLTPGKKSAMLKYAQSYVDAGLAVFPTTESRTPCVKGFPDLTPTDPNPEDYKYGYGISLSNTWLVIDYDPRRDEPGQNQLKALWSALGLGKTGTYIVRTGRGGCHVYFRKPSDTLLVPDLRKLGFPAIELKSAGRYVIGPGSPHPEGDDYRVEKGSLAHIEDAPQALLDMCKRVTLPTKQDGITVDDEVSIKRFERHCKSTDAAVKGDGGDITTYTCACLGKTLGLSEGTVYDVMAEHFIDRCSPPGDLDFLQSKIANAFSYSQDSAGSRHPYADFGFPDAAAIEASVKDKIAENAMRFVWDQRPGKVHALDNTLRNGLNFFQLPEYRPLVWVDGHMLADKTKPLVPNPLHRLFKRDLFAQQNLFTRPAPWHKHGEIPGPVTDDDATQLRYFFNVERPYVPSKEMVYDVITLAAYDQATHPVRDWLNSLVWDGVPRLDMLLPRYAGTSDTPYSREVGKNTIIGAVARVMDPGCKHDEMLVLEGEQGIGKSTFVSILGGEWYAVVKIDPSPNGYLRTISAMRGKWFLEEPEMEITRKSDVEALKAFLTIQTDIGRLAYGRSETVLPRQSVFIGTTNPHPEGYLRDPTGNRRFWPVFCQRFDLPELRADRDQLFAEAVSRYIGGEPHHIADPDIQALAVGEQNARIQHDSWQETIINWLAGPNLPEVLTTDAIAYGALNLTPSRIRRDDLSRICRAVEAAGYVRKTKRINAVATKIWVNENWI